MGLSNEAFSFLRKRATALAARKKNKFFLALPAAFYALHMVLAYFVMLLVMTYEAILFTALIFGLFSGYFLFSLPTFATEGEGASYESLGASPCCGGAQVQKK